MKETRLRPVDAVVLAFVVGVGLFAPFFGSRLLVYNLTIVAIYSIVVISLNLLLGLAGQASFAQTTFMAIGGYGSAILTTRFGVNPWLAIAISLALSIATALVIGKPLLRLRGHYLSMGTIALALGTASFANASAFTNGGWGISGVPSLTILGLSLRTPVAFYSLAWLACALSLVAFYQLANSHIGRAWRALSTRQDIAVTMGIDVPRFKLIALLVASFMASICGSLYVEFTHFVGPDLYDISIVINLMFMLFIGGLRSVMGPVVGAAFVIFIPQTVVGFERAQNFIFYLLLLLVILVWPSGLLGNVERPISLDRIFLLMPWLRRSQKG